MQTYYINRAEEKVTQTGKQLKKLELSQEGKQYPIKGVTIWGDNPIFAQAIAGATLQFDLYETDSGTPNPNAPGKNYINRTVNNPNQSPQVAQPPVQQTPHGTLQPNITEMALKTHMDGHFAALRGDLKIIADFLKVVPPPPTAGETNVVYPLPQIPNGSVEVNPNAQINPEDIPF